MAKVVVTFTDNPDGTITIEATPSIAKLSKMKASGEYLSVAHNYAIICLKFLHAYSKGKVSRQKIVRN